MTQNHHTLRLPVARQNMEVFNETTVNGHDVGNMDNICSACGALMFKDESHVGKLSQSATITFSACCGNGNIKLPPLKNPPDLLKNLLTGNTHRDKHFRDNIRAYNSSLAFASLCLTGQEFKFKNPGPYCYRINGQLYHVLSQMQPEHGQEPTFSQIYIYDHEHELDYHMKPFTGLDASLLLELQQMIKNVNPYAHKYLQVAQHIAENPAVDIKLVLRSPGKCIDQRRYNLPTGTDVAVIMPPDTTESLGKRDVVVYKSAGNHPNGHKLMSIASIHPMYDPLMYVLMFPFGDKGFSPDAHPLMKKTSQFCSAMQYYKYRLMPHTGDTFNTIHRLGRLFQQYVVDMYSKIEFSRLQYLRFHQTQLRADLYQGLADVVHASDGQVDGSQLGKKIILPSSFTGGPRYQLQLYQDAMSIVRRFGKPDFFVTFTCNPRWQEISDALFPGQTAENRQDIVARVFKLKLKALLHDLFYAQKPVLGNMVALIYVIEWQKRGPPHAHILGICDNANKPRTTADYDSVVSAEIPDKQAFPELYQIVSKFMMHGPCGVANPNSPCMEDGKCTKKFPKDFTNVTMESDGYPQYRRRNDGKHVIKNGVPLDNRYIVPYNPYLAKKIQCAYQC